MTYRWRYWTAIFEFWCLLSVILMVFRLLQAPSFSVFSCTCWTSPARCWRGPLVSWWPIESQVRTAGRAPCRIGRTAQNRSMSSDVRRAREMMTRTDCLNHSGVQSSYKQLNCKHLSAYAWVFVHYRTLRPVCLFSKSFRPKNDLIFIETRSDMNNIRLTDTSEYLLA